MLIVQVFVSRLIILPLLGRRMLLSEELFRTQLQAGASVIHKMEVIIEYVFKN